MRIRLRSRQLFLVALCSCLCISSAFGQAGAAKKGAAKGSPEQGEAVFTTSCALCHYADKTDTKIAPGLKGVLKGKELPGSHKPATEANVRAQIENGDPNAKPVPMPPFKDQLTPAQINDLIAYLKTL